MLRVFVDTEFTGFISAELISLGMMVEDKSKAFYREVTNYNRKKSSSFVKQVVEPLLFPDAHGATRAEIAAASFKWIEDLGEPVHLIADHVADFEMLDDLWDSTPSNVESMHLVYKDLEWFMESRIEPPVLDIVGTYDTLYLNYFLTQASEGGKNLQHHALNDCAGAISAYSTIKTYIEQNSKANSAGLILPSTLQGGSK